MYTKGKWRMSSLVSPEKPERYASIYAGPKGGETEIASINVKWAHPDKRREVGHIIARRICHCVNNFDAVVKALREYGTHGKSSDGIMCERDKHSNYPCTCGFEQALAQAKKGSE